ncbi:bromodomain adjacent to zinc finger domain 2A [Pelobates cultripes]|uniref:Bromodomain adjacent to zinc finger domain 2A n=1 Tax=Pelobates cultripes TaxID=61616 RepID=A0AAD1R622_PELCU|nr:bromodomain adjacent to zinc finger domain 2A [Pelobates cultripes]
MEANNYLDSSGQPTLPKTSGLKQLPQSSEPVYMTSSHLKLPQQAKGLSCEMPVNGRISPTVSANAQGTFTLDSSPTCHPASANYDYLWKYTKSPILKDCHGLSQCQVNGSSSPVTNGPSCKGSAQENWENHVTSPAASLSFGAQDLCNFNEAKVKVATAANGTNHDFFETSKPVPGLDSCIQTLCPSSNAWKPEQMESNTTEETNNGRGLVECLEPSHEQTDKHSSECNGTEMTLAPFGENMPSTLPPPPDVSNLDDPSQLPSQLEIHNSDSLEPFGTAFSEDPGSSNLFEMEEQEVETQQDNIPLLEHSSLDCPSYSNSASFPPLTENNINCSSMFSDVSASPSLGDSLMQDKKASSMKSVVRRHQIGPCLDHAYSASDIGDEPEQHKAQEPTPVTESISQDEIIQENTSPEPSSAAMELEEEDLEPGEVKSNVSRRRMASAEEVRLPLLHGWKREVRIKKGSHRWQGETWYYAPCGKRMKQFPEVIKYLSKNSGPIIRREHFSFSPRMPVGDFYEERDTAEGKQWVMLCSEEIPSRILAITGKRGRPRNMEKAKLRENKVKRGRGRPPKVKMIDLLSKPDAKLLRKLENQDILSDVEKVQLSKLKKKMRRKARNQEAKLEAAKRLKEQRDKEEKEKQQKAKEEAQEQVKKKVRRKTKEKPPPPIHKPDRKQLAQQRRQEQRKRQQFMLEELKKPTEDMCLSDHQPLPDFPRVPGVVLPSRAFSDCLTTVEFLQTYAKVLGFDGNKDVPSLCTLQNGLFNVGDSVGEVQDLLVKLLQTAMIDPGLPHYWQSIKILGERISEISLNRDNVSEILRLFLEAYGGDFAVCDSLRTHPFQALPPHTKAVVLAFLVNELNGSNCIITDIDKTLENISNYRKNKWIIEGKLRRLKFALGKRASRPAPPVTTVVESRRRSSTRVATENDALEEDDLLQQSYMGEESEEKESLTANLVDLERQIDKLTKRQVFFRKKILASSQRLRCVSLGQDRYRRFYWMLPHLGGIFVEGCEEITGEAPEPERTEETPVPIQFEASEVTEEKSFNSATRSRGRPRKPKTESEYPCKSCQCRGSSNGILEPKLPLALVTENKQNQNQSAFNSWLARNQTSIIDSTVLTPESSPSYSDTAATVPGAPHAGDKNATVKQNQWVHLPSRTPFIDTSHDPSPQPNEHLPLQYHAAIPSLTQVNGLKEEKEEPLDSTLLLPTPIPCCTCSNLQRNEKALISSRERRRGRPPSNFFKQIEQKYHNQLIERPIPSDMRQMWWWIKDPVMLESLVKALHPRGIREKVLLKHITKHLEHLKELCARPAIDSLFSFVPTEGHPVSQETLDKWSMADWTFQVDLSILQWVEDLEQRVLSFDLQLRGWTPTSLDSVRSDLKYFEHHLEATDDITVKVKKEEGLYREPSNPLDLAVLRLLDLEQNVERRYLKEPLWVLSEVQHEMLVFTDPENPLSTTEIQYSITSRLRLWRQTLDRCRSAAQVSLCLQQLEKSLAWERSVIKVICLVCRKGDNDECLLLCDSCDRGCHTYCHRPRMAEIPEGDWFCPTCIALQGESEFLRSCGSSKRNKRSRLSFQDSDSPSKSSRRREQTAVSPYQSAEASKRRRIGTRSQSPDLTFCEIILMELESHEDAWPFLEPVNPRIVPGYRKIIKNPMDFSTMRHKLLYGKYSSCEEFAEDAELVFSNCQLFNEDESEVGRAGLALKRFYDSRWEEFSQGRNQVAL